MEIVLSLSLCYPRLKLNVHWIAVCTISISISVTANVTACFVNHFICVCHRRTWYFLCFLGVKILTQTNNHPYNYIRV